MQNQERHPGTQADAPAERETLEGKSFQVNENTVKEGEPLDSHPPQPVADDKGKSAKVEGKAVQVNDNSIEN